MRLAFRIAYLGDGFFGSQVQTDRRTVEGEMIAAARRLALFDDWREARFASPAVPTGVSMPGRRSLPLTPRIPHGRDRP